ncbi:hypothetical protein VTN77DRAFT_6114 [Rasamsonia byssochlamydoides]|uniref:uncharacterized protein n=1 Tax=Rasamsonia byssochlamydoides TaxID=89139 RepID=UPI003742E201
MNSWVASSNNPAAGGQSPALSSTSPNLTAGLSSTPVGSAHQLPVRRRQNVVQPPALTTSLQPYGFGVGVGSAYTSTPTTSLSSPFSQSQSPYLPSPGGAARGSSPMALRLSSSSSYNAPYNPQEWGPVGGGSSPQLGLVAYGQSNNGARLMQPPLPPRPSDSPSSPPPPYSPPNQRQPLQHSAPNQTSSSSETASLAAPSPQYGGPPSTAAGFSPDGPALGYRHPMPRSRPLSMVQLGDASANWQSSFLPPPPPPPPGGPGSHSSSRSEADRHGVSLQPTSAPRQSSPSVYHQSENIHQNDMPLRPPSSKRAASTGAIHSGSSSRATSTSHSRSPPRRSWEPGMPLPPPPPGPPPATRSQSVSGQPEASSRLVAHPVPLSQGRPPPVLGIGLDRIPPTPAGWVDEDTRQDPPTRDKASLHVDTAVLSSSSHSVTETQSQLSGDSSSATHKPASTGLFRSPAIRDTGIKGIRERRVESRHKRHHASEDLSAASASSNPWADALEQVTPSNLVLAAAEGTGDNTSNRRRVPKPSPLSTRSVASDDPLDTGRSRTSSGLFSNRSSFSTPRPDPQAVFSRHEIAQTPPFSPGREQRSPAFAKEGSHGVPPKALPTPPPQFTQDLRSPSHSAAKQGEGRPVSHLLHLPIDPVPIPAPLSPRRIPTQQLSSSDSVIRRDADFSRKALQRYQELLEKEESASSEAESLKLFAEFIISESSIRRQWYSDAFDANSLDVEEVGKRLFQLPVKPPVQPERSSIDTSLGSLTHSLSGDSSAGVVAPPRPDSAWWNSYQPCLSPIASISIDNDEMSSRGRPPSRWWESKTGSSSEGGERRVQRSKRESKYMGVPRELREAMQRGYNETLLEAEEENHLGASNSQAVRYGPNEYPPEKVGWHEAESEPHQSMGATLGSPDRSLQAQKLDISRLITLPPPYPRHYPAVNNSHPDLITYRTTVRSISDLSEIRATRRRHQVHIEQLQQDHQAKIQEGRRQFKSNIQQQIEQGGITFAEAAEAEAALGVEEKRLEKELVQAEFDSYQETVLKPMHAILTDRIKRATECIDELSNKLVDAARHDTPDQTQEEGDEEPELLEKLTQLKWLFEAREQLYREIYELLSESNEKYRAVVTLPYKQSKNEDKIRETDAFFIKDAMNRRVQYEADALARLETFMDVVEENVKRGVEMHLSAFWDIAPSLLTLVQQIPENLEGFQIQIPAREYEENPSYHQFPLQYLYSLLTHAEKSTYQFIESQTNLLCLLHEVKSAVMSANCKLMEAQRIRHGEPEEVVRREMRESRAQEERELTADLKDRVATVEGQWTEALGSQIQALRERVKSQLLAEGGWEEMEQLVE